MPIHPLYTAADILLAQDAAIERLDRLYRIMCRNLLPTPASLNTALAAAGYILDRE